MKFLIAFISLLSAISTLKSVPAILDECNSEQQKPAHRKEFPYLAGLLAKGIDRLYVWCGGSLIAKNWVVTAAHCTDNTQSVKVYLGISTNISSAEVIYNVSSASHIVLHPEWEREFLLNDISLIRIPSVVYSARIKAVPLPNLASSYPSYVGDEVIVSGWGRIRESVPNFSKTLRWKRMNAIANAECVQTFALVSSRDLCATSRTLSSICTGDSGGPLVLETTGVQISLSSFGVPDSCSSKYPSGFMRITSYLNWIKSYTDASY